MSTPYCRHIRPSGRRCQSFALRNRPFCYHHESANAHLRTLQPPSDGTSNIVHPMNYTAETFKREPLLVEYYSQTRGPLQLQFPPLEDANSIQVALSMLLTALGQNRIETRRATAMLYNLQVASSNARHLTHNERCVVTDIVSDDAGNLLSPDEDPQEIVESELLLSNSDLASSSNTEEDPNQEDNDCEDESEEDDDYEDEEGDDYEDEDEDEEEDDDEEYEDDDEDDAESDEDDDEDDDYEDEDGNEDD